MPVNFLSLFASADTKVFVLHALSTDPFTPVFFQGESPPTGFTLLLRNPTGGFNAPWTKVNPASYSLRLGLFLTSSGAQLAFQDTFADNAADSSKYASFDFNSVAITAALGASASVDCTFEAEYTDAAGKGAKIQAAVKLYKCCITPTTATVPAGEVAATVAFVKATAMPKDGTSAANPVDSFLIKSRPSGIPMLVYWDDAGIPHSEPQGG